MPGVRWMACALLVAQVIGPVGAQEKKDDGPRITAISPIGVTPGSTVALKIRGNKLTGATGIQALSGSVTIPAEVKSSKAATVPNNLEAKDVGDVEVEASVTFPGDLKTEPLQVSVVTPGGITAPRTVRVTASDGVIEEKEPNNGFRQAQVIECRKVVRARVKEDKDVDVFECSGPARQRMVAEVFATRAASLLDPVLTVFDVRGNVLATCDDAGATRDPQVTIEVPADGRYFVVVQDASDRGTEWHGYDLLVKEAP